MTEDEKAARRKKCASMFETLGVACSAERLRGWLNATALIPFPLFAGAIDRLIRTKDDGYNTAPQPGQCWSAARSLIPACEWVHHGSGSLPPKWFRQRELSNERSMMLLAGKQPRRLADGSHDGMQHLEASTRDALESIGAELVGRG